MIKQLQETFNLLPKLKGEKERDLSCMKLRDGEYTIRFRIMFTHRDTLIVLYRPSEYDIRECRLPLETVEALIIQDLCEKMQSFILKEAQK